MQRVREDSRGKVHEVYFVNENDHIIFNGNHFGLGTVKYSSAHEQMQEYLAIELFLNYKCIEYTVEEETVQISKIQRALSQDQLENLSKSGHYITQQYFHGMHMRTRRARKTIVVEKKDGTKKYKSIEMGKFITAQETLNWLQLHADAGYTKVTIPGYTKSGNLKCRMIVRNGRNNFPASIKDGGSLFDILGPFAISKADNLLTDLEAHPVPIKGTAKGNVFKEWEACRKQYLGAAKLVFMISTILDVPRKNILDECRKDLIPELVRISHKLELNVIIQHYKNIVDARKEWGAKDEISLKDFVEPLLSILKLKDSKSVVAKNLFLSFKYTFADFLKEYAQTGAQIVKMRSGDKPSDIAMLYEKAWIDFAADMRNYAF